MTRTLWREITCGLETYLDEPLRNVIEQQVADAVPEGWEIVSTAWNSVDRLSPTFNGKTCSYYVFAREKEHVG